jgi:putative ABC transport system ATP-binding protein
MVLAAHKAEAAMPAAFPDIVQMSGVRFAWPGRDGFRLSVDDFRIGAGERLLLIGPSGGGKSTFLGLLAGIAAPQAGSIVIAGTDIASLSGPARDRFRAEHFGIIFQMFNLLPYASVLDNVLLPLSFSAERRNRADKEGGVEAKAASLLVSLGIPPSLVRTSAAKLSVGQQQRVAAARALIGSPPIVIADEPTSALDRSRQQTFLDLLFQVVADAGSTLIMVSHDEGLSSRFTRVVPLDSITRTEGAGGAA